MMMNIAMGVETSVAATESLSLDYTNLKDHQLQQTPNDTPTSVRQ